MKTSLLMVGIIVACLMVVLFAFIYVMVRNIKEKRELEVFFHAIKMLAEKHEEIAEMLDGNLPEFSEKKKLSTLKIEKIKVLKLLKMPLLGEIPAETMESYYLICSNCKEKNCKECYLRSQSQPQSS